MDSQIEVVTLKRNTFALEFALVGISIAEICTLVANLMVGMKVKVHIFYAFLYIFCRPLVVSNIISH